MATAPAPRQSALGQAAAAEASKDAARAHSSNDSAAKADRATARVMTGSKWDRKKGTRSASRDIAGKTKPQALSIAGLVDAFGAMNDPVAVALFEAREHRDEMLAQERAEELMRSRIAEVRAGIDARRLPALLRRQLAVHPAAWKHFSRLRKRFPELLVPPEVVHDAIIELVPSSNSREVHKLLAVFEWPECGMPDKTGKIDVQSLFDKVPLKSPATPRQKSPPTTTAPAASAASAAATSSKAGQQQQQQQQQQGDSGAAAATQQLFQLKLGGAETGGTPPRRPRLPSAPSQRRVSHVLGVLGNEAGSLLVEGPVLGPTERHGAPAARLDLSGEGPQAAASSAQLGSRSGEIGAKLLSQVRARHINVRDLFDALDADRDGRISLAEFGESLRRLGLAAPPAGYASLFAAFHAVPATAAPPSHGERSAPLDLHTLSRKLRASSARPLRPLLPPPPPSERWPSSEAERGASPSTVTREALFTSPITIPNASPSDSRPASAAVRPASPPMLRGRFEFESSPAQAPPLLTTPAAAAARPATASTRGSGGGRGGGGGGDGGGGGPAIWVCGDPKRPHSAKPPPQHTLLRGMPGSSPSAGAFALPSATPPTVVDDVGRSSSLPLRRPAVDEPQPVTAMPSVGPAPIALLSPAPRHHQPLRVSSSAPRLGNMRRMRLEAAVLPPPADQRARRGAAGALLKKQLDLSWFEQEALAQKDRP
mgnify:CR=1 FL=1